jgi:hypothetical protein
MPCPVQMPIDLRKWNHRYSMKTRSNSNTKSRFKIPYLSTLNIFLKPTVYAKLYENNIHYESNSKQVDRKFGK